MDESIDEWEILHFLLLTKVDHKGAGQAEVTWLTVLLSLLAIPHTPREILAGDTPLALFPTFELFLTFFISFSAHGYLT